MPVWDRKPDDPDEPINWVELKTSEEVSSDGDARKFERKLLKFWIQSFLIGVPKIIVGFRDKRGTLLRVEELATQGIPARVKRGGRSWDGNTCVNFAAAFLDCECTSPRPMLCGCKRSGIGTGCSCQVDWHRPVRSRRRGRG
jgi:RAT1-interacting protein